MKNGLGYNGVLIILAGTLLFFIVIGSVLYGFFGHPLVELWYKNEALGFLDQFSPGKANTPVENYYRRADRIMLVGAVRGVQLLFILLALITFINKPREILLACSSFLVFTFSLFYFFELFPALIGPLQLNNIPYYAYKLAYLPDDELVYREKPFVRADVYAFRGGRDARLYEIDVPALLLTEWTTDSEGFRNSVPKDSADVLAIGDSFMEHGESAADTFPSRLEKHLPGLTVANLGKAGYGPLQYLEVLKRYGIGKKPKYALFAFYEGNDISDTRQYLLWKEGEPEGNYRAATRTLAAKSIFHRYFMVLEGGGALVSEAIWNTAAAGLKAIQINRRELGTHPDLAILDVGDKKHPMLFIDRFGPQSTEEMLMTEEWRIVKNVLVEFRAECLRNQIVPLILYIPMAANVYAKYSTENSGKNWLQRKDGQIAARGTMRKAMRRLAREVEMEIIDLTPVFEAAAENGKVVYHSLDSHWNSEGMEIAAAFVAETLKKHGSLEAGISGHESP